jgi:hypothetical protein
VSWSPSCPSQPVCALLASALLVGCSWPEHRFRDDAADAALEPEDSAAFPVPTGCPPQAERQAACDVIRHFPGVWEVDGSGVEFCREEEGKQSTPPRRWTIAEAARTEPSPAPERFTEKVEVRVGISPYGMHVFVQVTGDPRVLVDRDDPVQGDAVEVFLRGTPPRALTGELAADDAVHLAMTPPSATAEGVGARYDAGRAVPLRDDVWHSRRVRGGYEVELHYPWSELKDANQSAPGRVLGFDVAIDIKDDPSAEGRELRAIMHVEPVASSPSCDAAKISPADPQCDDRTWCLAKAYVP